MVTCLCAILENVDPCALNLLVVVENKQGCVVGSNADFTQLVIDHFINIYNIFNRNYAKG
jgi:hypothetical protein